MTTPESSKYPRKSQQFREIGSLRAYLVKGATGSFALKACQTFLMLLTSVFLARLLGAEGYGAFANASTWVALLAMLATLGFHQLLIRQTAVYRSNESWGLFRGLFRMSNLVVLVAAGVLGMCGLLVGWVLFGHGSNPIMWHTLWIAMLIVPVAALVQLNQATVCGLGRVVLGQLPAMVIRPLAFLCFLFGGYFFLREKLTAPVAIVLQLGGFLTALGLGAYWLFRYVPKTVRDAPIEYESKAWFRSALPLLFVTAMQTLIARCDIIMLGAMSGAEPAGIYRVASCTADLILLSLFAVNRPLQPVIAEIHSRGNKERLQRLVTKATRTAFAVAFPLALFLMVFGDKVLLLFGKDFVQGHTALSILLLGRLVNVGSGMVGILLNMSSHERDVAWGLGSAVLLNVALNSLLIPLWGLIGATIAGSCSMIFWNVFLVTRVIRQMGIQPTVFGRFEGR